MIVLEIQGVTKQYDGVTAVDNLSLSIKPGGIFGLLGPNGAGKTTTIRMIMGIINPDEGRIDVFGEPFSERSKERIGYLPEERGLYRKMKVLDHIVFLAEIKGMPAKEAAERGAAWMKRLEIDGWEQKTVESLSKGMQQKIQFISTISQTLNEEHVGLEEVDDGVYDLYFCFYQIGRYHWQENRIEDIVSRVPVARRQIDLARRVSPMS